VPRRGRWRLRPRVSLLWMLDAEEEVAVVSVDWLECVVRTGTVVLDGAGEVMAAFSQFTASSFVAVMLDATRRDRWVITVNARESRDVICVLCVCVVVFFLPRRLNTLGMGVNSMWNGFGEGCHYRFASRIPWVNVLGLV